jgi:hypothetical protein
MFKIPRQSYAVEFKREAVKMVDAGQRPAEVARQLGVSEYLTGFLPTFVQSLSLYPGNLTEIRREDC